MNEKVLKLPKDIAIHRKSRTVCIDIEIFETIKFLWQNKIQTLGCCFGHKKENPSVIVGDGYSLKEIKEIEKLISIVDKREWDILQWKLTKFN
jgi:hypothetical protein